MVIAAAVFAFMLTSILGGYWLFVLRPETQDERVLKRRVKGTQRRQPAVSVIKAPERLSNVGALESLLSGRRSVIEPLERLVQQSGMRTTVGAILLASVFAALLVGAIVNATSHSLALAAAGACAAAALPTIWVRRAARKRLARFEELFPEAIDLLARALRAGHALTTALQMVADEIVDPVGSEFRQLFDQQNYGMSLPDALRAFATRVPLIDARFFVTALLTQRESGGNLSEILDNLARVIRERFRVKRQVRAISAHGRMTGIALGFLPPAVALILLIISPDHIRLLVDDPLGVDMVMGGIALQIIGVLIIRRIVNVEY